jgi:hypothetical protein
MRTRRVVALVIAILALPLLFLGLIDPLEGGIALIAAVVLGVGVRLLSKVPIPGLLWIPIAAAFAFGALALTFAIVEDQQQRAPDQAPNPLTSVQLLVVAYRLAVLVALAGAVVWVVRIALSLRSSPPHTAGQLLPSTAAGWFGVGAAIVGLGSWVVLPIITALFGATVPFTDSFWMPVIGLALVAAAAVANVLVLWLARQRSGLNIAATALTVAATLLLGMFTLG